MLAHGRAHGQKEKAELGHSIAIHGIYALSHEQWKRLDHVGPCWTHEEVATSRISILVSGSEERKGKGKGKGKIKDARRNFNL